MKKNISKWRAAALAVLTGVLSLTALVSAPVVHARGSYVDTWAGIYPASSAAATADCQLCHADSTQLLNPYGEAICSSSAGNITNRIRAVEAVDSDADPTGSNNLAEIDASTQPGWTPGNVNPTYDRGDCSPTGNVEAPPAFITGDLDPVAGNQLPVADANGPYSGTVNIALTLDGSASSDPDGSIVSFDWNFGDGNTGTGATPTHTYVTDGMFTVTLTVTDDAGATAMDSSTATIGLGNQPPVADANGPYSGTVGATVAFDGTGSSDSDGSIVSYNWDFGDGNTGSGPTPSHAYSTAGMFNVTLTVTDDSGASDSAATTADIAELPVNQPPVSDANGPYSSTVGVAISFDGSGSTDPDGSIVDYSWDFGDGNTGSGVAPSHTYSSNGNFTVTLVVTDDAGDTGTAMTTASIGTGNLPPMADPNGPYSGTVGVPVDFDGSGSNDPDGSIVSYIWDFGDGPTGSGPATGHSYSVEGTYNVTLSVTDDSGATDSAMTTAIIAPVPQDADVFLTRLRAPGRTNGRTGKTMSQRITATGNGDTITQDATVSLAVIAPAQVTVAINPASITQPVSPGNGATRYRFSADITCNVAGTYVLEWTATIAAPQNSDPGNDTLTDTTSVRCNAQGPGGNTEEDRSNEEDDDVEDENADEDSDEEENEDEDETDDSDDASVI